MAVKTKHSKRVKETMKAWGVEQLALVCVQPTPPVSVKMAVKARARARARLGERGVQESALASKVWGSVTRKSSRSEPQ